MFQLMHIYEYKYKVSVNKLLKLQALNIHLLTAFVPQNLAWLP